MYADMADQAPAETSMSKDVLFQVLTVVNRNDAVRADRQREAEAQQARQARRVARLNRQLDNIGAEDQVEGPRERRRARRPNYHAGFVVHMQNTDE